MVRLFEGLRVCGIDAIWRQLFLDLFTQNRIDVQLEYDRHRRDVYYVRRVVFIVKFIPYFFSFFGDYLFCGHQLLGQKS